MAQRLLNPFTPHAAASQPDDFYGRQEELSTVEEGLSRGNIYIQGGYGIGKTSLLVRALRLMEGLGSPHSARLLVASGSKAVKDLDEAAHLLLTSLAPSDEQVVATKYGLAKYFSLEKRSSERTSFYAAGRRLDHLLSLLSQVSLEQRAKDSLVLLAIDDVHFCPIAIAQLTRSIATWCDHKEVPNVRLLLSGLAFGFEDMLREDPGTARFAAENIHLLPLQATDTKELLRTKLELVTRDAAERGIPLRYDPSIITAVARLSGGHPHIVQLLGSYAIQSETRHSDGLIDLSDLAESIRWICFTKREMVYRQLLHDLDAGGKVHAFEELMRNVTSQFPTRIRSLSARSCIDPDSLKWFLDRDILVYERDGQYRLADEFLRIRILLDRAADPGAAEALLVRALSSGQEILLPSSEDAQLADCHEDQLATRQLPTIQLYMPGRRFDSNSDIRIDLVAKASTSAIREIDPERFSVLVEITDEQGHLVDRKNKPIQRHVILSIEEWRSLGECSLGVLSPGHYEARVTILARVGTERLRYSMPAETFIVH